MKKQLTSKGFQRGETWKFFNRQLGQELEGIIEAYWEVSFDPISDDYTPDQISACELFKLWVKQVKVKYSNNLIPILWSVDVKGKKIATSEWMPFQYEHLTGIPSEDFLTFFTHPVNSVTGKPLNWLTLPVVDKLWNSKRADKGGFIQQVTSWKPAILQPYVYLPALIGTLAQQ